VSDEAGPCEDGDCDEARAVAANGEPWLCFWYRGIRKIAEVEAERDDALAALTGMMGERDSEREIAQRWERKAEDLEVALTAAHAERDRHHEAFRVAVRNCQELVAERDAAQAQVAAKDEAIERAAGHLGRLRSTKQYVTLKDAAGQLEGAWQALRAALDAAGGEGTK
jgi:chromosome segregation ATPase